MPEAIGLRHMRKRKLARVRRGKRLLAFISKQQTDLNGTGAAGTFTGAAGDTVTWTTHGKSVGDGPFLLTTTGTLPGGLSLSQLYWIVNVPNANSIKLSTARNGAAITMTGAGSGVHTITKASSSAAVFEHLKKTNAEVVSAATDIDNL